MRALLQDLQTYRGVAGETRRVTHGVDVDTCLPGQRANPDRAPPFLHRQHLDACTQPAQFLQFRLGRVRRDDRRGSYSQPRAIQATPSALLPELEV